MQTRYACVRRKMPATRQTRVLVFACATLPLVYRTKAHARRESEACRVSAALLRHDRRTICTSFRTTRICESTVRSAMRRKVCPIWSFIGFTREFTKCTKFTEFIDVGYTFQVKDLLKRWQNGRPYLLVQVDVRQPHLNHM